MIFLDSSFIVAFEVKKDENHEKAVKISEGIINGNFGEAFISDYMLDETVTVTLNKTKDLNKAVLVGENLMSSFKMLKIEEETLKKAWQIFKNQHETLFSFTDCTILALMKENNIKYIATFDEDFSKIKEINVIQ